jgi:glucose-1-phosphate thymidylyltransferase
MRRADGSRLSAEQSRAADAGLKAMMPIGRPFLDYVLSALADGGVRSVCLVVGPDHEAIRRHYVGVSPQRLTVDFAVQRDARGTADAVLAARSFAGADEFLVLNADNYYASSVVATLVGLGSPGLPGFDRDALLRGGNMDAGRIRQYAMLQVDRDGYLVDIVEKPDESAFPRLDVGALVSMNLWRFSEAIFGACERVSPSVRGELELPGAVQYGIRALGLRLRVVRVDASVLDLSTRADIPAVAERLRGIDVSL